MFSSIYRLEHHCKDMLIDSAVGVLEKYGPLDAHLVNLILITRGHGWRPRYHLYHHHYWLRAKILMDVLFVNTTESPLIITPA